jgi:hypothetical protein
MVSFDPESQIGPNPYAEWTDEDLIARWNGFEGESTAMEVELLERGSLPLHEGLPNRKLVPGQLSKQPARAQPRGDHAMTRRFQIRDDSHGIALYEVPTPRTHCSRSSPPRHAARHATAARPTPTESHGSPIVAATAMR